MLIPAIIEFMTGLQGEDDAVSELGITTGT
jgi:hypothetical protein